MVYYLQIYVIYILVMTIPTVVCDGLSVKYHSDEQPQRSNSQSHPNSPHDNYYADIPFKAPEMTEEQRLMTYLLKGYERSVRPVKNASKAVVVKMGLTFTQIFDMDEKNQVLVTNVWLDQKRPHH
eukprot:XP_014791385.1 PREDICTED: neuronal acetylcholine receptor subunit alpha-2-like [Octopus bimaculoides]